MRSSAAKIQMTSFDDLFQPSGVEQQTTTEQIQDMSLKKLISFHNHPFQVRDDEEMQKTAESVAQYGVLVPAIGNGDFCIFSWCSILLPVSDSSGGASSKYCRVTPKYSASLSNVRVLGIRPLRQLVTTERFIFSSSTALDGLSPFFLAKAVNVSKKVVVGKSLIMLQCAPCLYF